MIFEPIINGQNVKLRPRSYSGKIGGSFVPEVAGTKKAVSGDKEGNSKWPGLKESAKTRQ